MKKNEEAKPELKPGDTVTYDGTEWELVEEFGGGKYAVISSERGRFSTQTKDLKKAEV